MGVKGCSIKLVDEEAKTLRFASTYGLSQDYLAKGKVDIDKSPINRRIFEGAVWAIGSIDEKDYFQYPEDIQKEGIASMICLPLRVEKKIFGIFCVYSDESYRFQEGDIQFFSHRKPQKRALEVVVHDEGLPSVAVSPECRLQHVEAHER
jgi:signal transduction protein with GAF and PtsI domain